MKIQVLLLMLFMSWSFSIRAQNYAYTDVTNTFTASQNVSGTITATGNVNASKFYINEKMQLIHQITFST